MQHIFSIVEQRASEPFWNVCDICILFYNLITKTVINQNSNKKSSIVQLVDNNIAILIHFYGMQPTFSNDANSTPLKINFHFICLVLLLLKSSIN